MLGDRSDADFPTWLDMRPPDYAATDHCVTFDLLGRRVEVFRGPGESACPVHTFVLPSSA